MSILREKRADTTVHRTAVRTLHGDAVRWDDLSERNREVALREAGSIARAYAGVEP